MIMMNMEFLEEFSCSTNQMIVKGKRTKRPRSSSSASSGGGELYPSPTTCNGISMSRNEDEDMANCLILLARGGSSPPSETATITNEKVGIYVYECRTCNRSFPSFQALGGHRASHKRPKPATDVIHRKRSSPPPPDHQEINATIVSSQLKPSKSSHHAQNKPKVHECSICGSEFASGQALGGHMRRHRSDVGTNYSKRIGTSTENDTSSHDVSTEKVRTMLSLDLNLPAPPEDDHVEASFHPYLVFSAAAPLVDCHY